MDAETAPDLDLSPEAVERLADRLNGIYRIPITDGLGPAGGDEPDNPNEFVRRFPPVPIQQQAAATLRALAAENARLRGVLKTLAEPRDRTFIGDPWAFYDDMTAYARAALAEGDEP